MKTKRNGKGASAKPVSMNLFRQSQVDQAARSFWPQQSSRQKSVAVGPVITMKARTSDSLSRDTRVTAGKLWGAPVARDSVGIDESDTAKRRISALWGSVNGRQ